MSHVLAVPAREIGDPIAVFILMEADDAAYHGSRGPSRVLQWAGKCCQPMKLKTRNGTRQNRIIPIL